MGFSQTMLMLPLVSLAWLNLPSDVTLLDWCVFGAAEISVFDVCYIYVLFGGQARDMIPLPKDAGTLMIAHHVVVMAACVTALFTPAGSGAYVAGSFALECGSTFYNLHTLYPDSTLCSFLYQIFMVLS